MPRSRVAVRSIIIVVSEITKRKLAEEALKESEERYRSLVENSLSAIILYRQEEILFANKPFFDIFGYKREELQSLVVDDIIAPEMAAEVAEHRRRRLAGEIEQASVYESKGKRKGGEIFDMEISVCVVSYQGERYCMAFLSDISKRKQVEEALWESEEKYRTLFEDSRDAIYINTGEGHFIDANQSMLDLFGYTRQEMINMNSIELYFNPEDRQRVLEKLDEKGFFKDYEINYKKKDGTKMDNLTTVSVRRADDGSILRYQGIIRDISEKKRLEAQFQQGRGL